MFRDIVPVSLSTRSFAFYFLLTFSDLGGISCYLICSELFSHIIIQNQVGFPNVDFVLHVFFVVLINQSMYKFIYISIKLSTYFEYACMLLPSWVAIHVKQPPYKSVIYQYVLHAYRFEACFVACTSFR